MTQQDIHHSICCLVENPLSFVRLFGLRPLKEQKQPYETYVDNWYKAMEQAHQLAPEKVTMKSTKRKCQFDKKTRAILLKAGDRVSY